MTLDVDGGPTKRGPPEPSAIFFEGPLAPGKKRVQQITTDNEIEGPAPWAELFADVKPHARDPRKGNNHHSSGRIDLE